MRLPHGLSFLALLALVSLSSGCGGHRTPAKIKIYPRPVSLQVEVYDPATNLVWEGLGVSVIEADHEWSGCRCSSAKDVVVYSDRSGTAFFSSALLGDIEVGFQEDGYARAVLGPGRDEDQVVLTIEVGDPTLGYVYFDIPIDFSDPEVFVSVPFAG